MRWRAAVLGSRRSSRVRVRGGGHRSPSCQNSLISTTASAIIARKMSAIVSSIIEPLPLLERA